MCRFSRFPTRSIPENKAFDVSQIGYRFALMEIKALVFTIFREIAFELPSPAPRIENGPA